MRKDAARRRAGRAGDGTRGRDGDFEVMGQGVRWASTRALAVARDERRVGRREASDVVHRASSRASRERGVVGVVARVARRARAATDRTTHARAAPTRATKVVIFYHG